MDKGSPPSLTTVRIRTRSEQNPPLCAGPPSPRLGDRGEGSSQQGRCGSLSLPRLPGDPLPGSAHSSPPGPPGPPARCPAHPLASGRFHLGRHPRREEGSVPGPWGGWGWPCSCRLRSCDGSPRPAPGHQHGKKKFLLSCSPCILFHGDLSI